MSQLTRTFSSRLIALCGFTLTLIAFAHIASAQTTSATDGNTPLGLSPGAAAGFYPLSDLDQIGLFNGDLNFKLPLMHIGGRGSVGYTMMLQPGQQSLKWRVWHQISLCRAANMDAQLLGTPTAPRRIGGQARSLAILRVWS